MTAGGIRSLRSRKRGDGEEGEEGNGGNGSSTAGGGGGGGRGKDGEGGQPSAKRSKQDGPRIKLRTYVFWGFWGLVCLCVAWPGLKGWGFTTGSNRNRRLLPRGSHHRLLSFHCRWRAQRMAEDYVNLVGDMLYPKVGFGPYGYDTAKVRKERGKG